MPHHLHSQGKEPAGLQEPLSYPLRVIVLVGAAGSPFQSALSSVAQESRSSVEAMASHSSEAPVSLSASQELLLLAPLQKRGYRLEQER